MSVVKQVLAGLFVLYLMFGIIKPAFKNLSKTHSELIGVEGSGVAQAYDADGNPIQTYDAEGNPIPVGSDTDLLGTTGLEDQRELDAGVFLESPFHLFHTHIFLLCQRKSSFLCWMDKQKDSLPPLPSPNTTALPYLKTPSSCWQPPRN